MLNIAIFLSCRIPITSSSKSTLPMTSPLSLANAFVAKAVLGMGATTG
jgi:hypothetical protein